MYNTTPSSQGDFFDEHLSAVLRDIVENDVDFLGEFFENFVPLLPHRVLVVWWACVRLVLESGGTATQI